MLNSIHLYLPYIFALVRAIFNDVINDKLMNGQKIPQYRREMFYLIYVVCIHIKIKIIIQNFSKIDRIICHPVIQLCEGSSIKGESLIS